MYLVSLESSVYRNHTTNTVLEKTMNTAKVFKALLLVSIAGLIGGCKLAIVVTSGGDVTSLSGTRDCAGSATCEVEITDTTFEETFTAIPREGYVFSHWQAGVAGEERYLCPGSTNPVCLISNTAFAGIPAIELLIDEGAFYYVLPRFEFVGIDTDGDGVANHLDTDDDNDGVLDADDNCPLVAPNEDGFGCPDPGVTLTFQSTVTAVFNQNGSLPVGVTVEDTVTFTVSIPVHMASAINPEGHKCFSAIDCYEGDWSFPAVPYVMTYSSGYTQSGVIDGVYIVNGGHSFDTQMKDYIEFYEGFNTIWEAAEFGGLWHTGPIPPDLDSALTGIDQAELFNETLYSGSWGKWGSYHYDYIRPQGTTIVTRVP